MSTLLEEFVLIAPYAEIEEVPDAGTSPEAPGGRSYPSDDTDEDDDSTEPEDDGQGSESEPIGIFEFPQKEDPLM